jgi:hypothetical protein
MLIRWASGWQFQPPATHLPLRGKTCTVPTLFNGASSFRASFVNRNILLDRNNRQCYFLVLRWVFTSFQMCSQQICSTKHDLKLSRRTELIRSSRAIGRVRASDAMMMGTEMFPETSESLYQWQGWSITTIRSIFLRRRPAYFYCCLSLHRPRTQSQRKMSEIKIGYLNGMYVLRHEDLSPPASFSVCWAVVLCDLVGSYQGWNLHVNLARSDNTLKKEKWNVFGLTVVVHWYSTCWNTKEPIKKMQRYPAPGSQPGVVSQWVEAYSDDERPTGCSRLPIHFIRWLHAWRNLLLQS